MFFLCRWEYQNKPHSQATISKLSGAELHQLELNKQIPDLIGVLDNQKTLTAQQQQQLNDFASTSTTTSTTTTTTSPTTSTTTAKGRTTSVPPTRNPFFLNSAPLPSQTTLRSLFFTTQPTSTTTDTGTAAPGYRLKYTG